MKRLRSEPLDLAELLGETGDESSGALVVFGGTVRNENDGQPVSGIQYSAYPPLAEKTLAEVEQETLRRFEVRQCRILHRIGYLPPGALSVLVVVRAAHRATAFEAAHFAIDTLKQRVPIWKEEHYADGGRRYLEGVPLRNAGE